MYFDIKKPLELTATSHLFVRSLVKLRIKFTAAVRHSNKFHSVRRRILMKSFAVVTQFDFAQPVAAAKFCFSDKIFVKVIKFFCSHHKV